MVTLDDFDVGAAGMFGQSAAGDFRQPHRQVHRQAHARRPKQRNFERGVLNGFRLIGVEARRGDDKRDFFGEARFQNRHRAGGHREIDRDVDRFAQRGG